MKKTILSGAIVVIIAAAASAPYFCGNSVEKVINDEAAQINASLQSNDSEYSYKVTEYKKGWFDATATSKLVIEGKTFTIDSNIKHGPYSYFGLGTIESKLSPETQKEYGALFDDKPIITSMTKLGFSNKNTTTIDIAAIDNKEIDDSIINWKGATLTASVNGNRMVGDFKAPLLSTIHTNNNDSITIDNLVLDFDSAYAQTPAEYKNINWSSKSTINIDKISVNTRGETSTVKFNLAADIKDDNSFLGYDMGIKLSDIQLPNSVKQNIDLDLKSFDLNLGFDGIPKEALLKFYTQVYDAQQQATTPSERELAKMASDLGITYLQGTPSIKFDTELATTQGNIALKAQAKLIKPDSNTDITMLTLASITRLEVSLTFSFAETLLDSAIAQGKIPQTKEEIAAALTQKNRFILNNGIYSGTFEFKGGKFYSNGQLDPELQQLLMGATRLF